MRENNRGLLKKIGKYSILGKIGQGRMGVVFHAQDPDIERDLAIKVIRLDMLRDSEKRQEAEYRFLTEARAAGKLLHPNIVTIFEVGRDKDLLYIAMEYLEGKDLSHYCRPDERLSIRKILAALIRLCDALDYAHRHGTIHRDIKPGNIFRTTDEIVKITDFGLAKVPAVEYTREGVLLGSPSYMSPEQIAGQQLDGRADIFALGVVMYELIMAERPFVGKDIYSTMYQISYEEPSRMDEFRKRVPPGLDAVLLKALAKSPDERYSNAMEMSKNLKHIMRIATQRISSTKPISAAAQIPQEPGQEEYPRTVLLSPQEIQRLLARRILVVRLGLKPEGLAVGVSEAVEDNLETPSMELSPIGVMELRNYAESTRSILEKNDGDPDSLQRLQELGFRMHRKLFGSEARKIFGSSAAEDLLLYVEDRLAGIHWELMHDGHDFFCLLFNMGRWPLDLSVPGSNAFSAGNRNMMILANSVGGINSVLKEAQTLDRSISKYPQLVKGKVWDKNIDRNKILQMGKVDIIHYSGAMQYVTKNPKLTGWILNDGLVPWKAIWEKVEAPEFLFAHAWKWEHSGGHSIYSPREVAAFARPLLEKGGKFYLGALHCADESISQYFVEPFYRELLEGAMVGQALRRSRLTLMNQKGEEFLRWSGYILYGMPTQRIFPVKS